MRFSAVLCVALALSAACRSGDGYRTRNTRWWKAWGSAQEENTSGEGSAQANAATSAPAEDDPASQARRDRPHETNLARYEEGPATQEKPDGPPPEGYLAPDRGISLIKRPPPTAVFADELVINDETITARDILEPITPELERYASAVSPDLYYARMSKLIYEQIKDAVFEKLVWHKAREQIEDQQEELLDKAVDQMEKERINRDFNGLETRYNQHLSEQGRTRDQVRERLRRSIVIDTYLRETLLPLIPEPRREELLAYYREHAADYSSTARRELLLIDVPLEKFLEKNQIPNQVTLAQARPAARAHIEQAAAALAAGRPFAEVAREFSYDVHRNDGGSWGLIEAPLMGRWERPTQRLFELAADETSEIIETEDAFFIVKPGQIESGKTVSFVDAQSQIADRLKQREFVKLRTEMLQKELQKAHIGSFDPFYQQIVKSAPQPKTVTE